MNLASALVMIPGSLALYVGLYHLLIYLRLREQKANLWFALACLSTSVYDFLCAGLYSSTTPAEGVTWQRWQVITLAMVSISIIWFVAEYCKRKRRIIETIYTIYFLVQVGILLVDRSELTFLNSSSITTVSFLGSSITYNEMNFGMAVIIQSIAGLLIFPYVIYLLRLRYLEGYRQETRPLMLGISVFAIGAIIDSLVSMDLIGCIYVMEYCYLALLVSMAYAVTTEQIKTHKAFKQKEEQYRLLFNSIPDIIIQLDKAAIITSINEIASRMLGYKNNEMVGRHIKDFIHPDDVARLSNLFDEAMKSRTQVAIGTEFRICANDGRVFFVSFNTRMNYDESNAFIGQQGVLRDITETKKAHEEFLKLFEAVKQADESIIITDTAGRIEYVNPYFEQMTGYSKEEILGKTTSYLKSGKHNRGFYDDLWNTLKEGKTWRGRFTNRRKDGTLFEESAVISPVIDNNGKTVNYVAVKRDITQEQALETQLRESQKMEAIGRLAGGVAHDFTNSLVIILNSAQLIKRYLPATDATIHELADQIIKASEKTSSLTSQLLAFSHTHQLSSRIMNLNKLISGVEPMLQRIIGSQSSINIDLYHQPLFVKIDPAQIEQIIIHIAVNAHDAMPNGGVLTIQVQKISLTPFEASQIEVNIKDVDRICGDIAIISISDSGCGMTKDILSHIFEPFFTTKGSGRSTGLGLSTAYAIAKKHGGCIDVYSSPGHGSTFRIYLPIAEGASSTDKTVKIPKGKEKILLVDDDLLSRHILVDILKDIGCSVMEIDNSNQALNIIREDKNRFDIIIADLIMPFFDGQELAAEIAGLKSGSKVVITSAYPRFHLIKCGTISENTPFLPKPYTIENVAKVIRDVTGQAQA